jgi:hypothetical protein
MTKKMKTKGTGKAMRMKEEIDSTVIPGIKITRTIANMEKKAKDGSSWKTNRQRAIKKAVRERYPINDDIMDSAFTKAFDTLLPCDLFTVNDINGEGFMGDYVTQYRRSFGRIPLKLKGLDTHSKQLMMFDSDIEYFKITFPNRSKRWLTIKLNELVKQGILVRKKNHAETRESFSGPIPINAQFYIFAKNPGWVWKTTKVGASAEWVKIEPEAVIKAQEIIDTSNENWQARIKDSRQHGYVLSKAKETTTTESFMVSVFDIPLPIARHIRQTMPGKKSFRQFIADGKALSTISPEQFMEIRTIITSRIKNRHMLAMKTLHQMLKEISAENERLNQEMLRKEKSPPSVKKASRKKKPRNLVEKKTPPVEFVERALLAETLANWIVSNKELLNKRPKVAAFVLLTAIEDGDIKW